ALAGMIAQVSAPGVAQARPGAPRDAVAVEGLGHRMPRIEAPTRERVEGEDAHVGVALVQGIVDADEDLRGWRHLPASIEIQHRVTRDPSGGVAICLVAPRGDA